MLQVDDITVTFGGVRAVDSVSFKVEQGEILAICGPNGAGKTTLLNLVTRILRPTSGRIAFEGSDITRIAGHKIAALGIARTFQNIELFANSTVLTNLLLGADIQRRTHVLQELLFLPGARRQEIELRERVEDVIQFLQLQRYRDTLILGLPYGVRKVVELARALSLSPRIVLLDEPSSGLNDQETELMTRWIARIRSELGITVVMVEHNMALVSAIADRVVVMNVGSVLSQGTPAQIQGDPAVIRAYLG
jgi:branched-chain amino acid transport system ATP-binding protein